MKNDSYETIADRNRQRAWQVVDELNLVKIWEAAGARVNPVGSLATGLLAKHLDIDFHIYSEPPLLPSGFAAMARIAENASESNASTCCTRTRSASSGTHGTRTATASSGRST